jgi:hypothetical protein
MTMKGELRRILMEEAVVYCYKKLLRQKYVCSGCCTQSFLHLHGRCIHENA